MVTKDETQVKPQWYDCDVCGGEWLSSTPPEADQKLYELHGCPKGKRKTQQDAITCKHCGAVTGGSRCGCPEDIAQRKADDDASTKRIQEGNAQREKDREVKDRERKDRERKEDERQEKYWKASVAASRKVAERDQRDAELRDREQALKGRELTRSERRQDFYDAAADDSGQVAGEEALSTFESPMDGSDLDLAPTAMMQRKDGSTLFYDGKLNFLFGTPGSGKSWVALWCIHETLLRGRRAVYWDFEDTPGTLNRRSKLLGLDLADSWREDQFKYLRPGLDGSTLAMTEAMEWIAGGDGPTLVVIDSAESAGCPSDGADVAPWLAKIVLPFLEAGCALLTLDHVAKRKAGRPLGPIGSQHKLARIDGAALFVTGLPWTQKTDGHLTLYNHKDRHGQLPAPIGKAVARLVGTHEHDTLNLSIVAPETEDNLEEAYIPTLRALAGAGPDGAYGQQAMRDLVVGRGSQRDKAIGDLVSLGFIMKTPGKRLRYTITDLGREELAGDDEDESSPFRAGPCTIREPVKLTNMTQFVAKKDRR